jgi:hypothetical protein
VQKGPRAAIRLLVVSLQLFLRVDHTYIYRQLTTDYRSSRITLKARDEARKNGTPSALFPFVVLSSPPP